MLTDFAEIWWLVCNLMSQCWRRISLKSDVVCQSYDNVYRGAVFSWTRCRHIPCTPHISPSADHWYRHRFRSGTDLIYYLIIDELCQVADVEARQRLRSSSSSSLIVSRTRLSTVGDRAFPVAAASVWNGLPDLVTSATSVAVFRSRLKTHVFYISYPTPLWLYSACTVTLSCFGHYKNVLPYLLTHLVLLVVVGATTPKS